MTRLATGWAIIHPDGTIELSYFHFKEFRTKLDGYAKPVSKEFWMKTYRPDCQIVRAAVTQLLEQEEV